VNSSRQSLERVPRIVECVDGEEQSHEHHTQADYREHYLRPGVIENRHVQHWISFHFGIAREDIVPLALAVEQHPRTAVSAVAQHCRCLLYRRVSRGRLRRRLTPVHGHVPEGHPAVFKQARMTADKVTFRLVDPEPIATVYDEPEVS